MESYRIVAGKYWTRVAFKLLLLAVVYTTGNVLDALSVSVFQSESH